MIIGSISGAGFFGPLGIHIYCQAYIKLSRSGSTKNQTYLAKCHRREELDYLFINMVTATESGDYFTNLERKFQVAHPSCHILTTN